MKDTDDIFRIQNLNASVHGKKLLRDINYSVGNKEVHAFIGESGSGKTLSTRGLFGLSSRAEELKIDYEKLTFMEKPAKLPEIRKNVRFIFQDPEVSFSPFYRIRKQVFDGFTDRKKAVIDITEILKGFSLEFDSFKDKYPFEISGGMKQKLMIAVAVAKNPALIIADEITSNLDSVSAAEVLEILKSTKQKTSFIFITHNIRHAKIIADRISVFYRGIIAEEGPAEELLSEPLHFYTRYLLKSIIKPGEKSGEGTAGSSFSPNTPAGCPYYFSCPARREYCKNEFPKFFQLGKRRVRCFEYER